MKKTMVTSLIKYCPLTSLWKLPVCFWPVGTKGAGYGLGVHICPDLCYHLARLVSRQNATGQSAVSEDLSFRFWKAALASKLSLDLYFKGNRLDLMDLLMQYVYTGTRKVFFSIKLEFLTRKCISDEGHACLQALRMGTKSTEIFLTVMSVFPCLRKNCSLAGITQVSAVVPLLDHP